MSYKVHSVHRVVAYFISTVTALSCEAVSIPQKCIRGALEQLRNRISYMCSVGKGTRTSGKRKVVQRFSFSHVRGLGIDFKHVESLLMCCYHDGDFGKIK